MAVNKFGQSEVGYGIDKFGRSQILRQDVTGFKLTIDDNYDLLGKRLTNVGKPTQDSDAATKKFITERQHRFEELISNNITHSQEQVEKFILEQTNLIEKNLEVDFLNLKKRLDDMSNKIELVKVNFDQDINVNRITCERTIKNQIAELEKRINTKIDDKAHEVLSQMNTRITDLVQAFRLNKLRTADGKNDNN